jgi:hypothetical protein
VGHDRASFAAPSAIDTYGAVPPPENVTANGTAPGRIDPSAWRLSLASTGTQPWPRRTRWGTAYRRNVVDPSAWAKNWSVSLRLSRISTRLWHAFAIVAAARTPAASRLHTGLVFATGRAPAGTARLRTPSAKATPIAVAPLRPRLLASPCLTSKPTAAP